MAYHTLADHRHRRLQDVAGWHPFIPDMSTFSFRRAAALAAGVVLASSTVAHAQQATLVRSDSARKTPVTVQAVTVTATRRPTDVHDVPVAVSVVDSATIRERMPNSAADLLRELPGLDVVGTGPNQVRPAIRGQRGQRILLMQDGLRLNNSRRQQDFGELPALVDVADIERVEIVRGPSSVLYGSDAIGGVINLITQAPRPTGARTVRGTAGYQYGGAGNQRRVNGRVTATTGAFAFSMSGATRDASNYRAPSGSFGQLRLADAVELQDSGVRDESLQLYAGWRGTAGHGAWVRQELYEARDAGFGFVEPRVLGDTSTKIALTYPWQSVRKTTAGFNSGALRLPFVDKLDVSGYTQRNARDFNSAVDVFVPTGPGRTATVQSRSFNSTDVRTHGFRAEASKVLAPVTVTYGADLVYDDTRNRDSSWSRTSGFGPFPVVSSNTNSTTPNAIMRNLGLFAQGDWRLLDRLSVITGVRFHDVHAETKGVVANAASARQEANNRTSVYAVNALYRVTDNVRVVASHGRGFRAPNLIERYFSGPSTDGTAIQIANPALRPEQSRNVDVGVRVTNARVTAELFAFQSDITDGIIVRPTGRTMGRQAEFQNVNVERLETTGYEASVGVAVGRGVSVSSNYTKIDTKNPASPDVPVAGTYNSRLNVALGYRPSSGRFWVEYAVRHHGRQQDINLGTSPVGAVVPAFTVMHMRGGVRLATLGGRAQELTVAFNNLGNVLYAEAANSAFFRPEPARHLVVGVRAAF